MKDKIEVHKIDIKIGDKVISLKPEQAKELKRILNEMFEEKVIHEHHHDYYRYWWNYPICTTSTTPTPMWQITWAGQSGGTGSAAYQNSLTANTVQLALNES